MFKNKFKFVYLLLIGAVCINLTSCDDEDDKDTRVVNFEDLKVDSTGYWKGDTTGTSNVGQYGTDYSGQFTSGSVSFANTYTYSSYGASWRGFGYSTLADTSVTADYTNEMYAYGNSGAANSKTFAIAFSDGATITFDKAVDLKKVNVLNTTYAYKVIRDGNAYTDGPFKAGSWFTVTFTGYNEQQQEVGTTTFFLADYRDGKTYICDSWENADLSALKGVKTVKLTFDGSDKGQWGLNTPTYVCIDNLEFFD